MVGAVVSSSSGLWPSSIGRASSEEGLEEPGIVDGRRRLRRSLPEKTVAVPCLEGAHHTFLLQIA